jgi:hypothetical protein
MRRTRGVQRGSLHRVSRALDRATDVFEQGRATIVANAYINIIASQSRDRLTLGETAALVADVTRMPPMILLPLIRRALASRDDSAPDDETFQADVLVHNEKLIIAIRHKGAGFGPDDGDDTEIQDVRGRLSVLYNGRAQLTLRRTVDGSEAVVEIPYEIIARRVPDETNVTEASSAMSFVGSAIGNVYPEVRP